MFRFRRNPYVYVSGAVGAVWVLMAWSHPDNSYYMFPVLVAAAVPVSYRLVAGRALPANFVVGASIAGLLNVFLLSGMLTIAGKLDGPTLLPAGGNIVDSIVLGLAGALVGGLLAVIEVGPNRARRP